MLLVEYSYPRERYKLKEENNRQDKKGSSNKSQA